MPRIVTITKYEPTEHGPGGFSGYDVERDGKIADGLTLGEMLEQVLGLFGSHDRIYPMRTLEEIHEIRKKHSIEDCKISDF